MKKIWVAVFLLILVPFGCRAETTDSQSLIIEQYKASGLEDIYKVDSEVFPEFDSEKIVSDFAAGKGFELTAVLKSLVNYIFGQFKSSVKLCFIIIAVGFIIGLLCNMQNSFGGEGVSSVGFSVAYIIFAGILATCFMKITLPARDTIENLEVMTKATIPTLLTMLTMGGAVMSSGLIASGMLVLIQIITSLIVNVVLPLIMGSVALSLAGHISEYIPLTTAVKTLKQMAKWIMVFSMALYTGIFGVYGLAGAALDSSIGKATRFAVGSGIPVVGGIVADSIETVMGTIGAVRNIVGITGTLATVITAASPIIKTAIMMWIFRLSSSVLEPITDKRLVAVTQDVADSIFLVFAALISVCLLFVGGVGMILITGNLVAR